MVLNREKRSNAGRAPQRLDDADRDTPPASTRSTGAQKVILRVREESVASQGSKRSSEKGSPRPAGRKRAISTQPVSLRRQEDVTTASPSPEVGLLPFSDEEEAQDEAEPEEVEKEVEEIQEIKETPRKSSARDSSYTLELSIILGKKGIYNTSIKSESFFIETWEYEARRRASEAADKQKKDVDLLGFEASIKIGQQKPRLYTIEDAADMLDVDKAVAELQTAHNRASQASFRVALVANFEAKDRPDEDSVSTHSEEDLPPVSSHKRAHSEAKTALKSKKPRESASTRQRAAEEALHAAIPNPAIEIGRRHKCDRPNCPNHGYHCYNIPRIGHLKLNMADIREWRDSMKDDPAINIYHPPPGVLTRLLEGYKKQKEQNQQPPTTPQPLISSTASSTVAGQGMTLNINLSGGPPPASPLHENADNRAQDRDIGTPVPCATTPAPGPPLPSSPIPQARDEDARLFSFIQSRIRARPARRAAFNRARDLLITAGVGFSDLADLRDQDWKEIGIDVGIKMDLLKHDKIWHLQHPEAVEEVAERLLSELDLDMLEESRGGEL